MINGRLTFSDQISSVSQSCSYHIRQIRCIRPYRDSTTASTVVIHCLGLLIIDYCNSYITTFPSLRSPGSNGFRTLLRVLLSKPPNPVMHINPILRSFRWLKITEHIEYGAYLSLTASACKVLSPNQPSYLHLITVRPPRNTHSSSHSITLDRPSTSSSQRITDSYFQYAPRSSLESSRLLSVNNARGPISPILIHPVLRVVLGGSPIGSIDSPLSSPITPPPFTLSFQA